MKIPFKISAIVCALSLSGCSTVQSWFPDKEKDYQFTTELPPLVIPSDLVPKSALPTTHSSVETSIAKSIESIVPQKTDITPTIEKTAPMVARPALEEAETELSRNEIQVSLTHEKAPTLNLNVPSVRAWRIVGKALSRSDFAVTNRNQTNGQIHIQIADSKPKTESEKSLLDDTLSIFDGFVSNETGYVLQFREANSKTAVTALNAESQPLLNGEDNKVLLMLFDSIKTDLSK